MRTKYYVSPSGKDSHAGTTLAKPFRTIRKAVNVAKAGSTVYIRGGTYKERVILNTSGNSKGYITFSKYKNENVIIDGSAIDWGYDWNCLFNLNRQKYIKIIGLTLINSRWAGIGSTPDENGCEHILIKNCKTFNTQSSGIAFFTGGNITIDGNSVEKACVKENGSQEGISLSQINTFVVKNNHVFNITNAVQRAGGEAIDAKNGCINGKIYANTVNDIAKIGIYVDAYSLSEKNIEVYNNTVYNCAQGITVATEHSGALERVNIHDNIIKNCGWGLVIGGWNEGYTHYMNGITLHNNTLSDIGAVGIYIGNPEALNVKISSNRISGKANYKPLYSTYADLSAVTVDKNSTNSIIINSAV